MPENPTYRRGSVLPFLAGEKEDKSTSIYFPLQFPEMLVFT